MLLIQDEGNMDACISESNIYWQPLKLQRYHALTPHTTVEPVLLQWAFYGYFFLSYNKQKIN